MKEEYKIGEFGYFWDDDNLEIQKEFVIFSKLANIRYDKTYQFENVSGIRYKHFSHENPLIKKELTREEITAKLVKDNDLKVGDRVKLKNAKLFPEFGTIGEIGEKSILVYFSSGNFNYFHAESIEKVKEPEYIPFTWEDRDLFKGKWLRNKKNGEEYLICGVFKNSKISLSHYIDTLSECFETFEFLDGTPFGKLKQ